jgi:hypothetical protein
VFLRIPEPWMGQRFYAMFNDIFGRPPIAFYRPQIGGLVEGTLFLASNDAALWDRAAQPELAALLQASPTSFPLVTDGAPPSVTDDWPYVYHRGHTIPRTYLTGSLILLIIAFPSYTQEPGTEKIFYLVFFLPGRWIPFVRDPDDQQAGPLFWVDLAGQLHRPVGDPGHAARG